MGRVLLPVLPPSRVQYNTQYSVLPHPVQSSTTHSTTPRNMRGIVTILVCILGMIVSTMGGTRYTRDTQECTEATADMDVCTKQAYDNYKKAFEKGDDKQKPDWLARKSCTYLTESVETCGDKLVGVCGSKEDVEKQKDEQLKVALVQVKEKVPNWDSDKCPAMKAHEDRLRAAEAGDPSSSATSVTVSVLSFLVMAVFI